MTTHVQWPGETSSSVSLAAGLAAGLAQGPDQGSEWIFMLGHIQFKLVEVSQFQLSQCVRCEMSVVPLVWDFSKSC